MIKENNRTSILLTRVLVAAFFGVTSFSFGQQAMDREIMADGRTYVRIIGTGDPILIINGGPGLDSDGFKSLADGLSDDYQMILYDQRGCGKSPLATMDSTTLRLDSMVADMEQIRKALNMEEWVLLGHSFGGMLASYYTTKFPERVKGLILSSSGGIDLQLFDDGTDITASLSEANRDSLAHYGALMQAGDNRPAVFEAYAKYLAPAYLYDQSFAPLVAHRLTRVNHEVNGWIWSDMRAMNFDCAEDLATFEKPVLILQGKHDVVSKELAVYADSVFAESRLVFIDEAGHYGWLENPDQYYGEVRTYLSAIYREGE